MPDEKKKKSASQRRARNPNAVHYVDNKELLAEVLACQANDRTMTNKLAIMLRKIVDHYTRRARLRGYYNYDEDIKSHAMEDLVKSWWKFNREKGSNPFSYYTSCVWKSCLRYINQERHQQNITDALSIKSGLDPSYNYMIDYEREQAEQRARGYDDTNENFHSDRERELLDSFLEADTSETNNQ